MKRIQKILCTFFAVLAVVFALPTAGAVSDNTAQLYPLTLRVDGMRVYTLNEQQAEVPAILYKGSFYLPVRTAGEWTGKNVAWNNATRTVSLNGSVTSVFHTALPTKSAYTYNYGEKVQITPRKDLTITVDGAVQTFKTTSGTQIYPLLYRGTTYLPLRSVAGLIHMQPAWRNASKTDAPLVSLYSEMTDEQAAACQQYLTAVSAQSEQYMNNAASLIALKNDKDALNKQLDAMKANLAAVQAMQVPDVPYLKRSCTALVNAVDADYALLSDAQAKLQKQTTDELFKLNHGQATGAMLKVATESNLDSAIRALLSDYTRDGLNV